MNPKISVYLPTYNRLHLLKRAVSSLKAQTFKDFEVLIVDDRSPDRTADYLTELHMLDSRFVPIQKSSRKRGACASRNEAIAAARGTYITGLDDDDWFHPMRLKFFLSKWKDNYSAISTNYYSVSKIGKERNSFIGRIIDSRDIMFKNLVGSQVFTLRERLEALGGFDESLHASQDYDLWIRLIERFGAIRRYSKPLYFMDISLDHERVSTSKVRDKGTDQIIAKYKDAMCKEQVLFRSRIRAKPITLSLCQKFVFFLSSWI